MIQHKSNLDSARPPIVDTFGRVHNNLRVSVTDRCNIRCFYCMPADNVEFLPHKQILTFEEIAKTVGIMASMGVDRIRLTGGEPLVRKQLWRLIEMLRNIQGIKDIALTTNGILLADQAKQLREAGLNRLNISLDTLDPKRFEQISRRKGLDKVLEGIEVAQDVGFDKIRLNAISIAGITENEAVPLARFAREKNLELRFIEFMPLDADGNWDASRVIDGDLVRNQIEEHVGALVAADRTDPSQPAMDFVYADGKQSVGFINPVSQPFCGNCNRLRMTAEGKFRNCLFSVAEWDLRTMLRDGKSDQEIADLIRECVAAKKAGHGIDSDSFARPGKSMYQIGG